MGILRDNKGNVKRVTQRIPLWWRYIIERRAYRPNTLGFIPSPLEIRALHTKIFSTFHRIAISTEGNNLSAFCAPSWFVLRWILQFLKVVFVRAIVDIHLSFNIFTTLRACFPVPGMVFCKMIATQRIPAMVAGAAIARIRKHNIFVFVITYPVIATWRFCQLLRLTA